MEDLENFINSFSSIEALIKAVKAKRARMRSSDRIKELDNLFWVKMGELMFSSPENEEPNKP